MFPSALRRGRIANVRRRALVAAPPARRGGAASILGAGLAMSRQKGSQTTLRERVAVTGVGVHSGRTVTVTLNPAEPGTGIHFLRTDLDGTSHTIPAERGF